MKDESSTPRGGLIESGKSLESCAGPFWKEINMNLRLKRLNAPKRFRDFKVDNVVRLRQRALNLYRQDDDCSLAFVLAGLIIKFCAKPVDELHAPPRVSVIHSGQIRDRLGDTLVDVFPNRSDLW